MGRAPSFCAIILAAGESTRMGRDKALLPWPPLPPGVVNPPVQTFLSMGIRALRSYTDVVIVVVGKNAHQLEPIVYAEAGTLVENPAPERGQFSSLQVGLHEVLNLGRDAAMITLVDRPPVGAAAIEKLHGAFESAVLRRKWAVIPEYNGKHGHPYLIGREMMEIFLRAPATANARDLEHENVEHIEYVPVDDPRVTTNIDTPEDYEALLRSMEVR